MNGKKKPVCAPCGVSRAVAAVFVPRIRNERGQIIAWAKTTQLPAPQQQSAELGPPIPPVPEIAGNAGNGKALPPPGIRPVHPVENS
jgi:hypothetical protein